LPPSMGFTELLAWAHDSKYAARAWLIMQVPEWFSKFKTE